MSDSFVTLWTIAHQAPLSMDFPDENAGVGCHFLLLGSFLTEDWTCISCIAGGFFTAEPPGKPELVCYYLKYWKSENISWLVVSGCLWFHGQCSLPGFSVHVIFQERILEWIVIPFSKGYSQPRDWTRASCIAGRFISVWATRVKYYCSVFS